MKKKPIEVGSWVRLKRSDGTLSEERWYVDIVKGRNLYVIVASEDMIGKPSNYAAQMIDVSLVVPA